jgi:DMSO reductase anchor subunit
MRPAFSVLFLTTLIGAGQGLLIALVTGQWYFVIGAGTAHETGRFYAIGTAVAVALLGLGLVASVFHLANPQRGWRAAARWRTSWLSREVVVLPLVMGLAFLYGVTHWFGWNPVLYTFGNQKSLDLTMAVGFLAGGAAGLLFVCTGMIYACVRFIREWASFWTVINYTLMGLSSGFVLAAAYTGTARSPLFDLLAGLALTLTALALGGKLYHLWLNTRLKAKSTMKSAIGVHHEQIRQLTQGFLGASFNTTEFTAPGGKDSARGANLMGLLAGFALPLLLVSIAWGSAEAPLLWLAAAIQYVGLLAERWAFFAGGNHVQNMYYQRMA